MRHVLLTPDYPTNALIEPLCTRGFRITVVGKKKELTYLKNTGCQFLLPKTLKQNPILANEISEVIQSLKDQVREENSFQFDGQELLSSTPDFEWKGLASPLFRAYQTLDAVKILHRRFPIDLLIVHEEVSIQNRSLLAFAKARGIAAFHVPHANCIRVGPSSRSHIHSLLYADYQVFGSAWCADRYSHCLRPHDFTITGNPEFDRYAHFELHERKKQARNRLNIHEKIRLVTFLSSACWQGLTEKTDIDRAIERSYRTLLRNAPSGNYQMICKLHPASDETMHERVEREESIRPLLRTQDHFEDCVAAADWVVVYGPSNSIIETVLMGQKAIVIDAFENERGVVSVRSDPEEIEWTLERALRGDFDKEIASGREEFIRRFNMANDGRAAQRVVEFIESVLSLTPNFAEVALRKTRFHHYRRMLSKMRGWALRFGK